MEQLNRDFRTKYALIVEATLEPSDALRARVYREFGKRTMSVVPASRIKSVLHQATPRQQDAVKLGEGIQLELEESRTIRTVVDYYWSLRTLAYAWAWAGLHQQRGHDGKETVFISLTAALNYADHALSSAMEFSQGSRLWLERNDLLTLRNSLLGNGFHIPSVMALLCCLPSIMQADKAAIRCGGVRPC